LAVFRKLPDGGQELRPKHVGETINKKIVQQVGIKHYICNIVAQEMYDIKSVVLGLCCVMNSHTRIEIMYKITHYAGQSGARLVAGTRDFLLFFKMSRLALGSISLLFIGY